jgi:hypothetical protein
MLCADELLLRLGGDVPYCAKFPHANNKRRIFHHAQREALIGKRSFILRSRLLSVSQRVSFETNRQPHEIQEP